MALAKKLYERLRVALYRKAARTPMTFAVWIAIPICAAAQQPHASGSPLQRGTAESKVASPTQRHAVEWGLLSGGTADLPKGVREGKFWAVQLRWGRVLTNPHGKGFLRGTLEYAFEIVPSMVLSQSGTLLGAGFNPLLLQYNFVSQRRLAPFVQTGGGLLFTTREFPQGTSRFNYTTQAGIGAYWLRGRRAAVVFGARYHHVSNAGLTKPNPGHDALYIYTGVSWWR